MPIAAGTRLGPYEIVGALGAGGMGEVYKARDTRLERLVAIKVLPEALAADATFRERFTREAKSLSALNHPHICALYDIGREGATEYLVLEYLEGETLAERLRRQRLAVSEAITLAVQVADALDAAHRAGLVHRDLKPANIFLLARSGRLAASASPGGGAGGLNVKLLDFGLAKPVAPVAAATTASLPPTRSQPLTAEGTLLGTFQYMAPEQLEGREADARTDLFAFGAVIYEVLTGRRAFEGTSQASVMGAIMHGEPPPIATLQPLTPPALDRIVHTCLAKHPDDRFQAAHDVAIQLAWIKDGGSALGLATPEAPARCSRDRLVFTGVAVLLVLLGVAAWMLKPAPSTPHVKIKFTNVLPAGQEFTRIGRRVIDISPDGTNIVYVADKRLYLRHLADETPVAITGTGVDPLLPTFSPDGASIAYLAGAQGRVYLWRVPAAGGTPTRLCEVAGAYGMSWARGRILYGDATGIRAVDENGGAVRTLTSADRNRGEILSDPQLLPDDALVFTDTTADGSRVLLLDAGGTAPRVLVPDGADGRVISAGYLVFYRASTLFVAAFDRTRRTVRGSPVPLVSNVDSARAVGDGQYAVSTTGTLVFKDRTAASLSLVWVDRKGNVEPVSGAPLRPYEMARLSPDGTRMATATHGDSSDIFVWDTRRSVEEQVTTDSAIHANPVWMPGGAELLFATIRGNTSTWFRRRVDLATPPEPVHAFQVVARPLSISSDGATVLLEVGLPGATRYLARLSLRDRTSEPIPLTGTDIQQGDGTLSPDGRWVAYRGAMALGSTQLFVRPFPDATAGQVQLSQGASLAPTWSSSGGELFYLSGAIGDMKVMLMSATVTTSPTFQVAPPRALFDATPYTWGTVRSYDAAPDGRRFVMLAAPPGGDVQAYSVVTHWFDEVEARLRP